MPIFTNHSVYESSLSRRVTLSTLVSYESQVVATFSKVQRIMSDVWDDVYYAVVAELDADQVGYVFKTVNLGCGGGILDGAIVDAPESAKVAYAAYLVKCEQDRRDLELARARAAQAARNAAEATERARVAALPKRGDNVQVRVDGRCRNPHVKAANGKTGLVFWVRDGRYGIALSDARDARGNFSDVVWCHEGQIQKVAR